MNTTNEDWRMKEKPILTRLEKAEGGWGQRLQALEGRAREAEAALQESLLRQEKMAAMYEESILERAGEEAAESAEEAPPRADGTRSKPPTLTDRLHADMIYSGPVGFRLVDTSVMQKALMEAQKCPCLGTMNNR